MWKLDKTTYSYVELENLNIGSANPDTSYTANQIVHGGKYGS